MANDNLVVRWNIHSLFQPKQLSASFIHASLYPIAVLAPIKYLLPTLSQKPALLSAVLKHGIKFITKLSS